MRLLYHVTCMQISRLLSKKRWIQDGIYCDFKNTVDSSTLTVCFEMGFLSTHNSHYYFYVGRKTGEPGEKLSRHRRKTTHQTNSTHIQSCPSWGSNSDHSGERQEDKQLSLPCHRCTTSVQNSHPVQNSMTSFKTCMFVIDKPLDHDIIPSSFS